jgi:methylenetetrahydrofolate--tRNA-(uracil-5-)-methyltransferase
MGTTFHIVGGGLAGCEAAWQILKQGQRVVLHEMRPGKNTPAHQTGDLAELVCSNSFKAMGADTAPGRLKADMAAFDSLILAAGDVAKVPAGQALAVDRAVFAREVMTRLAACPLFERRDGEVTALPSPEEMIARDEVWIVATGPLTSQGLAASLQELCPAGARRLYFYDAIAPIIAADSIDMEHCFHASRYGRDGATMAGEGEGASEAPQGDYLNLPLERDEYEAFIDAVVAAEYMPLHEFEEARYFEACLPIEVMVSRGRETLRFGPMKPVGLVDPRTGRRPWANLQLRLENREATMYSMVGFQTKMKWPEQRRVFGLLAALREAEFLRFGSVHRNTYLESPKVLAADLSFRASPRLFLAGQITGVEGYVESAAIGLLAGRAAVAKAAGHAFPMPPATTMLGALHRYVTQGGLGDYQPMNANLGLLPPVEHRRKERKPERKVRQCAAAAEAFAAYRASLQAGVFAPT